MRWVGAKGSWSDSEEWEGCDGEVEVGKTVVITEKVALLGRKTTLFHTERDTVTVTQYLLILFINTCYCEGRYVLAGMPSNLTCRSGSYPTPHNPSL